MPLTGVTGWPVAHSRSPELHEAAFEALGLEGWRSQRLPIPPELFDETVAALPVDGFAGINVTIPHKVAALGIADSASATARSCGAANTLTFRDGQVLADNTDVIAIESAIAELTEQLPAPPRVLLMGAGGTARAALVALERSGLAEVEVWNRTPSRAHELTSELGGRAVDEPTGFDLLINTTSVGLTAGADDVFEHLPVSRRDVAQASGLIDLVYSDGTTGLVDSARASGVPVVDGLELLVRQGARSIEIWTGKLPPLDPLRAAVASPRVG